MEAILAERVTISYGRACVLDAATMSLDEGERVVVFGPTGSGKTTLLYVIAGLVRPDAGHVRILGGEASGNGCFMPPEERCVGMVFQRPLLWPHMSAIGNVEFALLRTALGRAARRARALEALALFGVDELAGRRPETLSGGQAQRVALARSIAAEPRILLWDEPFTGLDDDTRSAVAARALDFIRQRRITLVAVSHDRADAGLLAAAALAIKEGRLEALE